MRSCIEGAQDSSTYPRKRSLGLADGAVEGGRISAQFWALLRGQTFS
jgi:hypothetical protein